MEVSEIITLVLQELDMNTPHVREYMPLPYGSKEIRDALSIIVKISDIDEHSIKEIAIDTGCTVATATNALNRFYTRIADELFECSFDRCLKKYFQHEKIKI